ncbi:MAG TPA: PH domain-containing protein [Lautropia sp.]|nr:PH domain-containing protein [Lautropia sp.]
MELQPLERGQLGVMLVRSILIALVLLGAAAIPAFATADETGIAPGLILGGVALLLAYPVLVSPIRRYRSWGYALGDDELRLSHGIWTHLDTVVPLRRVQHLDVAQGPIERTFGVTRLVLHTAGTMNSQIVLPGLSRNSAEGIRDEIRAQIRQEPE